MSKFRILNRPPDVSQPPNEYRFVWEWFKKNWPMVLVFSALWAFTYIGFYQLLESVPQRFIPRTDDGHDQTVSLSFIMGLGLTSLGFYIYYCQSRKLRLFNDAFLILYYLHPKGLGSVKDMCLNMRKARLGTFDPSKDMSFGLVLEKMGVFEDFSWEDHNIKAELTRNYDFPGSLYWSLCRFDDFISDNLDERVKRKYPKQVYGLRLHLLSNYADAAHQGKMLIYHCPDESLNETLLNITARDSQDRLTDTGFNEHDKVIVEFCKMLLNKYYEQRQDYPVQPEAFDPRQFRKHLADETKWEWQYRPRNKA